MNKLISIFLLCSIVLVFSACGTEKANSTESKIATISSINSVVTESKAETSSINSTATESKTENEEIKRKYTFRNAVWGDSIEQVKESESETFIGQKEDNLSYEGSICGYSSSIVYKFNDNKLYEGGYYISDIYTSAGQYISAYEAIKTELYEKYGNATEDEIINFEQDSLIEMAGASRALEYGYVAYRARWETSTTKIMLGMMSENYDVYIVLSYNDKNYVDTSTPDGI